MYPELREEQIDHVVGSIKEFMDESSRRTAG
jgi:hypothetical protein